MRMLRTTTGYRLGNIEIESKQLTPRAAQLALLTAGQGKSIKEAAPELGTTIGSATQIAQRLYYKLGVNSLHQATVELYRRGIIKHLCAIVFVGLSATPQADANELYRRPPTRYKQYRARCRTNRRWATILDQLQPQ